MKKLYCLVYPSVAILSLAAAFAARADASVDTYREGYNPIPVGLVSTRTHAAVRAELAQARVEGSLDVYREGDSPVTVLASSRTRADVRAEMFTAKAAGWDAMSREDSGAFYLSQQRPGGDASRVMAAAPARISAK